MAEAVGPRRAWHMGTRANGRRRASGTADRTPADLPTLYSISVAFVNVCPASFWIKPLPLLSRALHDDHQPTGVSETLK